MFIADSIVSKNSLDFNLQDIIENQTNSQESIGDKIKEEIMETDSFENRSFSDIAIDDPIEKQLNDL